MAVRSPQKKPLTIVVVEDHVMFRQAIVRYLKEELGHKVLSAVGTGTAGVEAIDRLGPELVILDMMLPDGDGLEVAEQVLPRHRELRVLVLSSHSDDYTLFRIEKSGVHGFLDKNSQTLESIGEAIGAIATGHCYYSPAFREARVARAYDPNAHSKVLTDWQRRILSLIGRSLTDDEIAEQLRISPKTVATHRGQIMRRLGIPSTPKLINFAITHGFTQLPLRRGATEVYS